MKITNYIICNAIIAAISISLFHGSQNVLEYVTLLSLPLFKIPSFQFYLVLSFLQLIFQSYHLRPAG